MDYQTWKAAVLNDAATRDATKAALRLFDAMDPVDAANDCAMLCDMLGTKVAEAFRDAAGARRCLDCGTTFSGAVCSCTFDGARGL